MMRDKALNKLPYSPRKATKTHSCSVVALSNFWKKVLTVSREGTCQSPAALFKKKKSVRRMSRKRLARLRTNLSYSRLINFDDISAPPP